jgi:succinate dehydrogenase/fumarate reductase flavoprotein subunit
VKIVDRVMITDLLVENGQLRVLWASTWANFYVFRAGPYYGRWWYVWRGSYFGHKPLAGDAYAMMLRAGVEMMNFDIISRNQAAMAFDLPGMATFQGLGCRFVNSRDEEFMPYYDPELRNLALKKTQALAMAMEVREGRGPIYLDMTHFSGDLFIRGNLPLAMLVLEQRCPAGDKIVRKVGGGRAAPAPSPKAAVPA